MISLPIIPLVLHVACILKLKLCVFSEIC